MYNQSLLGWEDEDSRSKNLELGLDTIRELKANVARLLLEVRNPLVEKRVCYFQVLGFTLEAPGNHAGTEITPVRHILVEAILLVDFLSSIFHHPTYFVFHAFYVFFAHFGPIEELDCTFGQPLELLLRVHLLAQI